MPGLGWDEAPLRHRWEERIQLWGPPPPTCPVQAHHLVVGAPLEDLLGLAAGLRAPPARCLQGKPGSALSAAFLPCPCLQEALLTPPGPLTLTPKAAHPGEQVSLWGLGRTKPPSAPTLSSNPWRTSAQDQAGADPSALQPGREG